MVNALDLRDYRRENYSEEDRSSVISDAADRGPLHRRPVLSPYAAAFVSGGYWDPKSRKYTLKMENISADEMQTLRNLWNKVHGGAGIVLLTLYDGSGPYNARMTGPPFSSRHTGSVTYDVTLEFTIDYFL